MCLCVRLDLRYYHICQYSGVSRLWVGGILDAIYERVSVNGIIMDAQQYKSGVDWMFLMVIIGGELSVTFLGTCFSVSGWWEWGVRWSWWWWRWVLDCKPCSEVHALPSLNCHMSTSCCCLEASKSTSIFL